MLDKPIEAETEEIASLIERAGVFTKADVECVRELLDHYFHTPGRGGYDFIVYRLDGRIGGLVCFGPAPLTEGTYDFYWLAVAPEARRRGIARTLMAEMEKELRQRGARLLTLETSSTPGYQAARDLYLASGFQRQATIPDFYAPGDDMIIYTKRFDRKP